MEKKEKLEAYYQQEHPFRDGINQLRTLALQTESLEEYKWSIPVYTVNGKNVFGICKFKGHFGVWFFHGSFLSDPQKVLRNAQEGKTKGMRHWYFTEQGEVDQNGVLAYMSEAIENEKKGLKITVEKSQSEFPIPDLLLNQLEKKKALKNSF